MTTIRLVTVMDKALLRGHLILVIQQTVAQTTADRSLAVAL